MGVSQTLGAEGHEVPSFADPSLLGGSGTSTCASRPTARTEGAGEDCGRGCRGGQGVPFPGFYPLPWTNWGDTLLWRLHHWCRLGSDRCPLLRWSEFPHHACCCWRNQTQHL